MIIHGRIAKSKKRKVPKSVQAEYDSWLKGIEAMAPKITKKVFKQTYSLGPGSAPAGRETKHYPSLNTGLGVATKPVSPKVYTGTKIVGIATMHKSNAVPVFNDEQAKDISSMRR
jgi:hypothetical protein